MIKTENLRNSLLALFCLAHFPASASWWDICPEYDRRDSGQSHSVYLSPYTYHWRFSEEHTNVAAAVLKRHLPNDRFCGFSLFRNSFGQPSIYVFTGWEWDMPWSRYPRLHASVSAGIMYGYVGEYRRKVPLNIAGFSPAIVPAIGYRLSDNTSMEVQILGTAALMFGVSRRF